MLNKEQIKKVMWEVHDKCTKDGVKYALMGGALFVLLDLDGYETNDIDIVANENVDYWKHVYVQPDHCSSEWVFNINDIKVDWIIDDKIRRDFHKACMESAELNVLGFYSAPLSYCFAIKLAVGRPKDLEFCEAYREHVDPNQVQTLLDQFKIDYKYN